MGGRKVLRQKSQMIDRLEVLQRRVSLTPGEKIEVEMLLKEKWLPRQVSCHWPEGSIGGAIGVPNQNVQRGEDVLMEIDQANRDVGERIANRVDPERIDPERRLQPQEYQGNG
jgi:hypothetical protein